MTIALAAKQRLRAILMAFSAGLESAPYQLVYWEVLLPQQYRVYFPRHSSLYGSCAYLRLKR